MNEQGIEVPEDDQIFSLKKIGASYQNVDPVLQGDVPQDVISNDSVQEMSELEFESEDDNCAEIDQQMEKMYDLYLSNKSTAEKTKSAVKRTKVAKRALAGQGLVQDSMLYDGDQQAYHKMIQVEHVSLLFLIDIIMYWYDEWTPIIVLSA
jgi:AdoMet-dependent rRNA methyltransferase SPB1